MDLGSSFAGIAIVAIIVAVSLAIYAGTRWLLADRIGDDTRDLAGSVMFRVAAIHGLTLALVFAEDLLGVRDVSVAAAEEATLVSDIYHDAERFDAEALDSVRRSMARYAVLIVEEEWSLLAKTGRLSPAAWAEWERAYDAILDAVPVSARQERLHRIMLEDVRELSALRDARENAAQTTPSTLFVASALIGIVLIAAGYFTFPATALHLTLISAFAAYSGLILYMILAFSNPFAAPGWASTLPFDRFLSDEVREMAERAD